MANNIESKVDGRLAKIWIVSDMYVCFNSKHSFQKPVYALYGQNNINANFKNKKYLFLFPIDNDISNANPVIEISCMFGVCVTNDVLFLN